MTTITIPKELTKEPDLIAVPRITYGEFLAWQRKIKSMKIYKPTAREKKALARARRNLAAGNYLTLEELKYAMESHR